MKNKFLRRKYAGPIMTALLLTIFATCGGDKMKQNKITSISLPQSFFNNINNSKIFFGHQSVGENILDGFRDLMKTNSSLNLKIIDSQKISEEQGGFLAHMPIGENGKPKTKIKAFSQALENGIGKKIDIAVMKLCYVDISERTDTRELFKTYSEAIKSLQKKFPEIKFLHMTVPLTTEEELFSVKDRVKELVKKITGKITYRSIKIAENIKRFEYNSMLRIHYGKSVIDIAMYESTDIDKTRYNGFSEGIIYEKLIPSFSTDGGHLNESGRIHVADMILTGIAEFSSQP